MFKQILWNFGILELSLLFVSSIYCSKDQVQFNKNIYFFFQIANSWKLLYNEGCLGGNLCVHSSGYPIHQLIANKNESTD